MNTRNFGIAEGRLTRDPYIAKNENGSRKVMLTIAAQDNFKSKDGTRKSQFINLEGFIPANMPNGVYDLMHKGDMVGIEYSVRTNNYTAKSGEMVYSQVLFIQSVDLKETKKSIAARGDAQPEAASKEIDGQLEMPAFEEDAPY